MILVHKTGTIKRYNFDGKIYKVDGTVLAAGFAVTNPFTTADLSKISKDVVEYPGHNFKAGDSIGVIGADGIVRHTFVSNVGADKIELKDSIVPSRSVTVKLVVEEHTITFTSIDNGMYTFSDNEALIIADTFLSVFVSYSDLHNYWGATPRNLTIESLNVAARNSVLADMSKYPTFYKSIDLGQLKELILKKMTVILTADIDKRVTVQESYDAYLKTVYLSVDRVEPSNGVTDDITDNDGPASAENTSMRMGYGAY